MSSIHTYKAFCKAQAMNAQAAASYERWAFLTDMSKRELAEIVCHLAALATESYDETIGDDAALIARVIEERHYLVANGML